MTPNFDQPTCGFSLGVHTDDLLFRLYPNPSAGLQAEFAAFASALLAEDEMQQRMRLGGAGAA